MDNQQADFRPDKIQTFDDLVSQFAIATVGLKYVFTVKWEITEESADDMIDTLMSLTKAFADNYHRLATEGKIPIANQFRASNNIKQIDKKQ